MGCANEARYANEQSSRAIAAPLVAGLLEELEGQVVPLFVGLDGPSGAGKSTLASVVAGRVAGHLSVTVIEGDSFYSGGSGASWDRRTPEEKAARVIDWRTQRRVLEQLRDRGAAEWHPSDWTPKIGMLMTSRCRAK